VSYKIKEIYFTLQGEGAQSGRPAVFCRFAGCNLWSGREEDRSTAICKFCDTDFWGIDGENGGKYNAEELAERINSLWSPGNSDQIQKYVVMTGGEPALQLDEILINELHKRGFKVAIETNGTLELPEGLDWVCMSPKANTDLIIRSGNELKIIYPQTGIDPENFIEWQFDHFFIQPMDGSDVELNTHKCIEYCLDNPKWSLSLQIHKYLNIR
jgi:7-carboxy-7-deazaguanine synthase (Cx14CxxC type)